MTEGELLDIERRFRAMEQAIENADKQLAFSIRPHQTRKEIAEDRLNRRGQYDAACRAIAECERVMEPLQNSRDDLQVKIERTREDFDALLRIARNGVKS